MANSSMVGRVVRYAELRPCTTAFIDTRTPGSAEKENFTIIGPGVAESRDQHVHIDIPHGFNIGAARQPPGCVNSQHSHETAEVFVVHTGRWTFYLGAEREGGKVMLGPGDTISIPVHVFRGFENIGDDVGFMFAVLGGDDPGRVTWAPDVFDKAKEHGLILLEDGSLVDTKSGEAIPNDKSPMSPTTAADVARLRKLTADEMADCVVRYDDISPAADSLLGGPRLHECPIIGKESTTEGLPAGRMAWPHGFHLRHMAIEPGASCRKHRRQEEEVIMLHKGELRIDLPDADLTIGAGDVVTVPVGLPRTYSNPGFSLMEAFVVRGGDHPGPPTFAD